MDKIPGTVSVPTLTTTSKLGGVGAAQPAQRQGVVAPSIVRSPADMPKVVRG